MFVDATRFAGQVWLELGLTVVASVLLLDSGLLRRQRRPGVYSPELAWRRAWAYVCMGVVIASLSGALTTVSGSPLATLDQLVDPLWWLMTLLCAAVVFVGYAVIWPMGTFTDNRPLHGWMTLIYGGVWGLCQALLFLSIWAMIERAGLAAWWVAALSFLAIATYNGLWHRFVWDIYVSPPHNYTEWNARKVLLCHTPNLIVCLSYLAIYGNVGVFVLLQAYALAVSAWAMHFPKWSDAYTAKAGEERSINQAAA